MTLSLVFHNFGVSLYFTHEIVSNDHNFLTLVAALRYVLVTPSCQCFKIKPIIFHECGCNLCTLCVIYYVNFVLLHQCVNHLHLKEMTVCLT